MYPFRVTKSDPAYTAIEVFADDRRREMLWSTCVARFESASSLALTRDHGDCE